MRQTNPIPTILFFYILRRYLLYAFATIVVSLFLFTFFDFLHKSTRYFPAHEAELSDIASYYFFQIPVQIVQTIPIGSLLGSIICMVILSRSNEITAMRAAGMGPMRLALPILTVGALLSSFSYMMGEWVAPPSSMKMHYIQDVRIEGKDESVAGSQQWLFRDQVLFYFSEYDPGTQTLKGVEVIRCDEDLQPRHIIAAEEATHQVEDQWIFKNGMETFLGFSGTSLQNDSFEKKVVFFPSEVLEIQADSRKAFEIGIDEFSNKIKTAEATGIDSIQLRVDYHYKLAVHFAALVLSLLGLRFGYQSERRVESSIAIFGGVATGLSYWVILNFSKAFALDGILHPALFAWSANIILFVVGIYLAISKVYTKS